ncbi:hypothetical protein J6590_081163 [Homalodisca vitripennis]|nr:hypothetical protein J6590_081163 [Homalodisca vitripennis]
MVCHAQVNLSGATCLKLDITLGGERMSLLAIYRSPPGDLDSFISDFEILTDIKTTDGVKSAVIKAEMTNHYFTVSQSQPSLIKRKQASFVKNTFIDCDIAGRLVSEIHWTPILEIEDFLDGKVNIHTNDINNVANTLNEYYVGVGANLASAVTEVVMNDEDYRVDSNFQLVPISEDVLARVVQNLRGRSTPGEDGIPATLNKMFFLFIKASTSTH